MKIFELRNFSNVPIFAKIARFARIAKFAKFARVAKFAKKLEIRENCEIFKKIANFILCEISTGFRKNKISA